MISQKLGGGFLRRRRQTLLSSLDLQESLIKLVLEKTAKLFCWNTLGRRSRSGTTICQFGLEHIFSRLMQRAVCIYQNLAEAKEKLSKYKKAQLSSGYSRIGAGGQKLLNGHRVDYSKEVASCEKKLNNFIDELVKSEEGHHAASKTKLANDRYSRQELKDIRQYLDEVKGYAQSVRSTVQARDSRTSPVPHAPRSSAIAGDESPEEGEVERPRKRRRSSLHHRGSSAIKSRIDTLTKRIQEVEDELRNCRLEDVSQAVQQAIDGRRSDIEKTVKSTVIAPAFTEFREVLQGPSEDIAHVRSDIGNLTNELAILYEALDDDETQLGRWREDDGTLSSRFEQVSWLLSQNPRG